MPATPPSDDPPADDDPLWRTKDGREIPFSKMETEHMRNARRVITPWSKGERDEAKRLELKSWRKTFALELRKRDKSERTAEPEARTAGKAAGGARSGIATRPASAESTARRDAERERARQYARDQRARQKAMKAANGGVAAKAPSARVRPKPSFGQPAPRRQRAPDHWSSVLGIPDDADVDTIERAFRDQAKLAHPDSGGSANAMRQLIAAREWALRDVGNADDSD